MSSQVAYGKVPEFNEFDRLDKALQFANMTRAEMADYLEVDRKTVGNWLTGRTPMKRAAKVAWALRTGVPLSWLETGEAPAGEPVGGLRGEYTARDSNPEPADSAERRVARAAAA